VQVSGTIFLSTCHRYYTAAVSVKQTTFLHKEKKTYFLELVI